MRTYLPQTVFQYWSNYNKHVFFETKTSKNPKKSEPFNSQRNVRPIEYELQEITNIPNFSDIFISIWHTCYRLI